MGIRQIRISTKNLDYPQENDCVLADDDPVHAIKKSVMLGGLGMDAAMEQYNSIKTEKENPTVQQTLAAMKSTEIRKFANQRKGESMAIPTK